MGTRENAADKDFSGIPLEEEVEEELKDTAVISMGTEISPVDLLNITSLCDQVCTPLVRDSPVPLYFQHGRVFLLWSFHLGMSASCAGFEVQWSTYVICVVQVIALAEYRAQLYEYLKSRMMAIAPNLTILVGELVGARLIAHAGSLVNLAKAPASTVQILGAEKALFRALKTKHQVCAITTWSIPLPPWMTSRSCCKAA